VIFLVNFDYHVYQFPTPLSCPNCSEKYQSDMVPFLRQFLVKNKIGAAVEESGNPYKGGMRKAQEMWGFKETFLQEAIEGIRSRTISHSFVDITKKQVNELVENGIIPHRCKLEDLPQLRDEYIAQAAREIFSKNKGQNGLLLVAGDHFAGVKDYFKTNGIPVESSTIQTYDWYKDDGERVLMHSNEEQDYTD